MVLLAMWGDDDVGVEDEMWMLMDLDDEMGEGLWSLMMVVIGDGEVVGKMGDDEIKWEGVS